MPSQSFAFLIAAMKKIPKLNFDFIFLRINFYIYYYYIIINLFIFYQNLIRFISKVIVINFIIFRWIFTFNLI
jgi:hypothetical protein